MTTFILLGIISTLLLLKCLPASEQNDAYALTIRVGNDNTFQGEAFKDLPKADFRGYLVELSDPSGCSKDLSIVHMKDGESSENALVTYIDWYSSSEFPCRYEDMVANLKQININHFILVIKPETRNFESDDFATDADTTIVILKPDKTTFDKFKSLVGSEGRLSYTAVEIPHSNEENTSIPMSSMAILFVTVAFVTLMTVSIGWLVFYYAQRCRQRNMRERLQSRLCVAAKRAVGKLPTKTVPDQPKSNKRSKKTSPPIPDNDSTCSSCSSDEGEFCPVCLDLYKPREVIRILPCKHEFHKNCVDPWLFDHRTCPMCKLDILEHLGMPAAGDRLSNPTVHPPPDYSENMSTRVDQEVQTDFASTSPVQHFATPVSAESRGTHSFGDEIEPAPILPQDV